MGLRRLTTTDPIGRIYFRRRSLEGEPGIDQVLLFEQAANHVHRLGTVEQMGERWTGAYKAAGSVVDAQPGFALRREAAMWVFSRWKEDQELDGERLPVIRSTCRRRPSSSRSIPAERKGMARDGSRAADR